MAVAGLRVVVWFHSGGGCGVPIADERFFEFAAGGMRHFERLDARWPSAVRGGGEQHALMCDVAYHPQPNGKTVFIRGEACGEHALDRCGPPLREASARRSLRDRIDQAMCDLRFGLLSFGQQLAKRTQRTDAGCGPSRGEAAARRWLAPSQSRCTDMGSPVQSAVERRGLRRAVARSSPPQAGGFGPPTPSTSNCMHELDSKPQLAKRTQAQELRAFAGAKLRPADSCAIESCGTTRTRSRDEAATHRSHAGSNHATPRKPAVPVRSGGFFRDGRQK